MAISRFYRGSSTFLCNVCSRRTRDTGATSMGIRLCPGCFELAGIENEISDGHTTREDALSTITKLVGDVAAKGGDVSDWNVTFGLGS